MTAPKTELRVVVSTPLTEDLCQLIERIEPRLTMVRNQSLLPPMRWPGDHGGDPDWARTVTQQADFDALVDSAEALYGIPDEHPAALARTAVVNPRLRWVHTMAAGGGGADKGCRSFPYGSPAAGPYLFRGGACQVALRVRVVRPARRREEPAET